MRIVHFTIALCCISALQAHAVDWGFLETVFKKIDRLDNYEIKYEIRMRPPARMLAVYPMCESMHKSVELRKHGKNWSFLNEIRCDENFWNKRLTVVEEDSISTFDYKRGHLVVNGTPMAFGPQRWDMTIFEPYSFLFDGRSYDPERDNALNLTDLMAPTLADLSHISNMGVQEVIDNLGMTRGDGYPVSLGLEVVGPLEFQIRSQPVVADGEEGPVAWYQLRFERLGDVVPIEMQKRDADGNLVAEFKVLEFLEFDGVRLPSTFRGVTYLNANEDRVSEGKITVARSLDEGEEIRKVDPAEVLYYYDEEKDISTSIGR